MKFMNVVGMIVALCATLSLAALELPQCFQYADTQIVGKFTLDKPADFTNQSIKKLSLLYDSFGINDCDHNMSQAFPSVMCNEHCPWISECDTEKLEDFKNALTPGKKLVFTGLPMILGVKYDIPFSCESKPIADEGFDEYHLVIYLPCLPGEKAMDIWNVSNITCTLDLLPGRFPTSEYPEFVQNVTLYSFCAGSFVSVSVLALLVSMLLTIFA